ncbi:MAG: hypothetical protein ABFD79_08745 [Phycisphaerales bacterium]
MKVFGSLCILILIALVADAKIYNYDQPQWDGYYIWAPKKTNIAVLEVNLYRFLLSKPGGSGELVVNGLLSNAAASGIAEVYWRLDSGEGKLLYPSADSNSILRWSNSKIDFSEIDYPALALKGAEFFNLTIHLVAHPSYVEEIMELYPNASIVTSIPSNVPGLIKEIDFNVETVAGSCLDQRVWYFRKDFNLTEKARIGHLGITAIEKYECYINGYYIGGNDGYEKAEIYNITNHLVTGNNFIAVKVFPPAQYDGSITTNCAGLIVNANWFDSTGSHSIKTDNSWKCNYESVVGWYSAGFDSSGWNNASIVGYWGNVCYPYYRISVPKDLLQTPENSIVLLEQNFEDEDVFRNEIGLGSGGRGHGGKEIGLWHNPVVSGDYEPKPVFDNSTFSNGSKCLKLMRGATTGSGYLAGKRDNLAITGAFKLEMGIKPLDGVQFSISVFDSIDSSSIDKVAISYNGQLCVSNNGVWVSKGVSITQNRWTNIRIAGNINSGSYDVYFQNNDEDAWHHLGTALFDKTKVKAINGVYIYPWNQNKRLYVDDVKLINLDIGNCEELLLAGEGMSGDINSDCYSDFNDLVIIAENWLTTLIQ